MEKAILKIISKHSVYPYNDVKVLYDAVKSYDKVLMIMDIVGFANIDLIAIAQCLNSFKGD